MACASCLDHPKGLTALHGGVPQDSVPFCLITTWNNWVRPSISSCSDIINMCMYTSTPSHPGSASMFCPSAKVCSAGWRGTNVDLVLPRLSCCYFFWPLDLGIFHLYSWIGFFFPHATLLHNLGTVLDSQLLFQWQRYLWLRRSLHNFSFTWSASCAYFWISRSFSQLFMS